MKTEKHEYGLTKSGSGLVADVDITDEGLPVQTLCWELLDLIQHADDWDIQFDDWRKRAEKLPLSQELVVRKFAETLRQVPMVKAEVGTKWGDQTKSRPDVSAVPETVDMFSNGIH